MAGSGALDIRVDGADRMATVARGLKQAGRGDLAKEMTAELRRTAEPVRKELQSAVMAVASKGVRGGGNAQRARAAGDRAKNYSRGRARAERAGTGLRQTISRAITVKVTTSGFSTGVRIRVDSKKLPVRQRRMPKLLNKPQWRHPVFGNRSNWVSQTGSPYWDDTITKHKPDAQRNLLAVVQKYADELERL